MSENNSVGSMSGIKGCFSELAHRLFIQVSNLLERHLAQGFLAYTQEHPLQEPVLLHLEHVIFVALFKFSITPFKIRGYTNVTVFLKHNWLIRLLFSVMFPQTSFQTHSQTRH